METWTVTHRKQTWDRVDRKWSTTEFVLAEGVSKSEADRIMAAHPDRLNVGAHPVKEGE